MNSQSIVFALTAIVVCSHLLLGLIVFLKNPKDPSHRWFMFLCLTLAVWGGASILTDEPSLGFDAQITALKVDLFAGAFGGFAFFGFATYYLRRIEKLSKLVFTILGLVSIFFAYITIFTDLVVAQAYFENGEMRYVPGVLDAPYALMIVLGGFAGLCMFIAKRWRFSGNDRTRIEYMIFGVLIPVIVICTFMLVSRLYDLGLVDFDFTFLNWFRRFSVLSTICFVTVTTFAIIKHELFGIRVVLGRLLFWFSLSIVLFGIFYTTLLVELHFFGSIVQPEPIVFNIVLAVVIGMFLSAFENQFKQFVERVFIFTSYNPSDVVAELKAETLGDHDLIDSTRVAMGYIDKYIQPLFHGAVITTDSDVWSEWRGSIKLELNMLEDPELLTELFSRLESGTYVRSADLAFIRVVSESLKAQEVSAVFAIGKSGLYFLGTRGHGKLYTDEELGLIKQMLAAIML